MGTTLTGTTPQDTYDSLIKVTNNGPLSSTARYLSDGLGNDSVLALSTAQVGIGSTTLGTNYPLTIRSATADYTKMLDWGTAVGGSWGNMTVNINPPYETILTSGEWAFKTNTTEKMRITSAGNVGIGTSAPTGKLQVKGGIHIERASTTDFSVIDNDGNLNIKAATGGVGGNFNITFQTGGAERARITPNGLTFNGDTAAANALDDYEEGTWTMGVSFGGASVGVTYSNNTGAYTKIGRQVTVTGYLSLTSKGTSTGSAFITGLPFTILPSNSAYSIASIRFTNVTFANQFQAEGVVNNTTIEMTEITEAGVVSALDDTNFANNSTLIVSLTYFV